MICFLFNFSLAANLCFKDIFLSPKSSVKFKKRFFILCKPYISDDLVFLPNNGLIYNYASILEVFTIISIAVFSVFNRVSLCSS